MPGGRKRRNRLQGIPRLTAKAWCRRPACASRQQPGRLHHDVDFKCRQPFTYLPALQRVARRILDEPRKLFYRPKPYSAVRIWHGAVQICMGAKNTFAPIKTFDQVHVYVTMPV